ncbi:hypothetical protein EDD22DRAFT_847263 [Suillus occidentalis]|nr:hypothetical protein EDD22DRAFT_847263 [Suillus occidentalis]
MTAAAPPGVNWSKRSLNWPTGTMDSKPEVGSIFVLLSILTPMLYYYVRPLKVFLRSASLVKCFNFQTRSAVMPFAIVERAGFAPAGLPFLTMDLAVCRLCFPNLWKAIRKYGFPFLVLVYTNAKCHLFEEECLSGR